MKRNFRFFSIVMFCAIAASAMAAQTNNSVTEVATGDPSTLGRFAAVENSNRTKEEIVNGLRSGTGLFRSDISGVNVQELFTQGMNLTPSASDSRYVSEIVSEMREQTLPAGTRVTLAALAWPGANRVTTFSYVVPAGGERFLVHQNGTVLRPGCVNPGFITTPRGELFAGGGGTPGGNPQVFQTPDGKVFVLVNNETNITNPPGGAVAPASSQPIFLTGVPQGMSGGEMLEGGGQRYIAAGPSARRQIGVFAAKTGIVGVVVYALTRDGRIARLFRDDVRNTVNFLPGAAGAGGGRGDPPPDGFGGVMGGYSWDGMFSTAGNRSFPDRNRRW